MTRIGIYVFPGVEELDFVGVYEVLSNMRTMKEDGRLSVPIKEDLQVDVIASEHLIT
mgnify:CR=1 FL=1